MNQIVEKKPNTTLSSEPDNRRVMIEQFVSQLESMDSDFIAAIGNSKVSLDQFKRTLRTAVQTSPALLLADRKSLWEASLKCAADMLIPDGKRAALVPFGTQVESLDKQGNKVKKYIQKVQYMPMVAGLIQLARASNEISFVTAQAVYSKDVFSCDLASDDPIKHELPTESDDRGAFRCVYAQIRYKDGSWQKEVMFKADIEQVRNSSKQKNGVPWTQWWIEMARKTVVRRLLKYAALTAGEAIESAIDADNEYYGADEGVIDVESKAMPTKLGEKLPEKEEKAIAYEEKPDEDASDVAIDDASNSEPTTGDLFDEDGVVLEYPKAMPAYVTSDVEKGKFGQFVTWFENVADNLDPNLINKFADLHKGAFEQMVLSGAASTDIVEKIIDKYSLNIALK